jgi:hypothetical protein
MRKTDLNIFYQMGQALGYLIGGGAYGTGKDIAQLAMNLYFPREWAIAFVRETWEFDRYFNDSRKAALALIKAIDAVISPSRLQAGHPVTLEECTALSNSKDNFENCFERETRYLSVFTVTPKGTYDTGIMLENPEAEFPDRMAVAFPPKFTNDLKQAARCLVFDIPVGCAFHICRATESLMIAYYEKLAKQPWPYPNRDWSAYINHLVKQSAPATITTRLREIKDMDRNAYIHPDKDVLLEEAQVLYTLCAAVNYYMLEEMIKP